MSIRPNTTFPALFLISLLAVLSGCRPTGIDPTNCREGKCTYSFQTGKQIRIEGDSTVQYVEIVNGGNHVLDYHYEKNDRPYITDDEYSEHIYFELDPLDDPFSLGSSDLAGIRLVMTRACFCPLTIAYPVSGVITGSRDQDGNWLVEFDVTFTWDGGTVERSFSARFEEAE